VRHPALLNNSLESSLGCHWISAWHSQAPVARIAICLRGSAMVASSFFLSVLLLLVAVAGLLPLRRRRPKLQARITPAFPLEVSNRGKRIGILVVAYNAVTTLSATLKRIPKDVWDQIEEVAVFDDASRDETYEVAVGFKTLFGTEKLTILRNERNLGYGGNQK